MATTVTRALLGAQGVLWIVLSIFFAARGVGDGTPGGAAGLIVLVLLCVNAAVFLVASAALPRLGRLLRAALAAFLVGNAVLSVTDQVGALDIATFCASAATLVLLIVTWRHGLRRS